MDNKIYERIIWVLISIGAVAVIVNMIVSVPELRSESAASWVQAIGSIVAIFGAFAIGLHQVDVQKKVAEQARQHLLSDRHSTIKGVIDRAYQRCLNIEPHLEGEGEFGNLSFVLSYGEEDFMSAITLLEGVPIYEVGSGELVASILELRDAMRSIHKWVERHNRIRNGPKGGITLSDEQLREFLIQDTRRARDAYQKALCVTGGAPRTEAEQVWW